ncbi:hypothetical protein HYFRA_00011140 [Hymenoscyphus fraxineus]|uniref:Uncharacterized protein n=1 Tax=Hymenoscyphus fraxineus TaxID=746836 RepID=A0A9N9PRC3_9HELO|nr:hypothetical protein HYFRA_00011140 [Hymenoscyphus fraxineus]
MTAAKHSTIKLSFKHEITAPAKTNDEQRPFTIKLFSDPHHPPMSESTQGKRLSDVLNFNQTSTPRTGNPNASKAKSSIDFQLSATFGLDVDPKLRLDRLPRGGKPNRTVRWKGQTCGLQDSLELTKNVRGVFRG